MRHSVVTFTVARNLLHARHGGCRQQSLAHGRVEAGAEYGVDMMRRPRRNLVFKALIEGVDFGWLDLLQRPFAQCRHDVAAQQLGVPFNRPTPYSLFAAAWGAGGKPLIDPLAERDLVRRNVRAIVAAFEQSAKLPASIRQRTMECLGDAPAFDSVAQAPGIFPSLIYSAVTTIASLGH